MRGMLDMDRINAIARRAAEQEMSARNVVDVRSETAADSLGGEALAILVVLRPLSFARLRKLPYVQTDLAIDRELRAAGEERLPLIKYATTDDLLADASPES